MVRMLSNVLLIAAIGLVIQGCAVGNQRFGRIIDAKQIAQVKPGTSTKQDVLDLFGPPTSYTRVAEVRAQVERDFPGNPQRATLPNREERVETKAAEDVFTYEYREDQESFFTALLYTRFRRDVLTDTLMVFFDSRDVVKYVAFAKQTDARAEDAKTKE